MDNFQMKVIGHIKTDFPSKFGIPRQSGLVEELEGEIVFEPEYRSEEALRGLEGFSHIWLIWAFSENVCENPKLTVRPPRLGGNKRMGVFATRSPFRPNPIGLSCVRIKGLRKDKNLGIVIQVCGADLMDNTPILDIKPYLPISDCKTDALSGFAGERENYALQVEFPQNLLEKVPETKRIPLKAILSHDPRPAYQDDSHRVYGFPFAGMEIKFTVEGEILTVICVE